MNILSKVTLKNLKKNKTRTLVTIIGVILSAAMFTGVTTFISSFQNFMLRSETASRGDWQGVVKNLPLKKAEALLENDKISKTTLFQEKGFAPVEHAKEEGTFFYLNAITKESAESAAVKAVKGRLPEKENEIVLSERVLQNADMKMKIGDTIKLNVGIRRMGDRVITTEDAYDENEVFTSEYKKEYTVVGFCSSGTDGYNGYSGRYYKTYTYLNKAALSDDAKVSTYLYFKNPGVIYGSMENIAGGYHYNIHKDLIEYMGYLNVDSPVNQTLYIMGGILILLIMVGSVSLIYNAFSISVSDRSKQFGMLSGVGATAKQIRASVFYEGLFIGIIGLPIGILFGIAGIGVTLFCVKDLFLSTAGVSGLTLSLSVSWVAVAISAAIGFFTILISAYIPAKRASKMSAIEAIRQTNDIKIKPRQVKTGRLARKIFGMKADLSLKNFKRNKRRYRTTVISLCVSMVLFISAFNFISYGTAATDVGIADTEGDIFYAYKEETDAVKKAYEEIGRLDGVEKSAVLQFCSLVGYVKTDLLSEASAANLRKWGRDSLNISVYTMDAKAYSAYIADLGLSEQDMRGKAIALDAQRYYDDDRRLVDGKLFKKPGAYSMDFAKDFDETSKTKTSLMIGHFADKAPMGMNKYAADPTAMSLVVSEETYNNLQKVFGGEDNAMTQMVFKAKDSAGKDQAVRDILTKYSLPTSNLYNMGQMLEASRNINLIVSVFCYGFIILISLIATANVFNTISTSIHLRRREFAMIKSVGMTGRDIKKMMNFECSLYGIKAILYGVPISLVVCALIYFAMARGISVDLIFPWQALIISVAGVFVIVFASMLYAMSKIKNESIVEALKNENL